MRFYGMTPAEIDDMTVEDYSMSVHGMEMIEANERLANMQAASIVDMKKSKRDALVKRLEKTANSYAYEERPMTHEEMGRLLNG